MINRNNVIIKRYIRNGYDGYVIRLFVGGKNFFTDPKLSYIEAVKESEKLESKILDQAVCYAI